MCADFCFIVFTCNPISILDMLTRVHVYMQVNSLIFLSLLIIFIYTFKKNQTLSVCLAVFDSNVIYIFEPTEKLGDYLLCHIVSVIFRSIYGGNIIHAFHKNTMCHQQFLKHVTIENSTSNTYQYSHDVNKQIKDRDLSYAH